jgi:hypothetical protein
VRRADDRIGPATDDRPYFYDVNRALPLLSLLTGVAGALLLAVVLVREAGAPGGSAPGGLVAGLLGAGFMTLESILIARGQFLLGGPAIAVPLVVGGMLTTAGASALFVAPIVGGGRPRWVLTGAASTVVCVALAQALLWPQVVAATRGLSTMHLAAITALMTAAIGLPAGLCFPACVEIWGRGEVGAPTSLYTLNALATVLGASLATLVSMGAGLSAAMAAGGAAYGLAALTAAVLDSR